MLHGKSCRQAVEPTTAGPERKARNPRWTMFRPRPGHSQLARATAIATRRRTSSVGRTRTPPVRHTSTSNWRVPEFLRVAVCWGASARVGHGPAAALHPAARIERRALQLMALRTWLRPERRSKVGAPAGARWIQLVNSVARYQERSFDGVAGCGPATIGPAVLFRCSSTDTLASKGSLRWKVALRPLGLSARQVLSTHANVPGVTSVMEVNP